MSNNKNRPDQDGSHRSRYDRNKKRIYQSQDHCGICGQFVDVTLPQKLPNGKINPIAPCIDHIIPIDKGGHPSDINNLQLAHRFCNAKKSNKLYGVPLTPQNTRKMIYQTVDWKSF